LLDLIDSSDIIASAGNLLKHKNRLAYKIRQGYLDIMSEIVLSIPLPRDTDGFLRRACPNCERQFKWWPVANAEEQPSELHQASIVYAYFCPYCFQSAPLDHWYTPEQLEYCKQQAIAQILGPQLRQIKQDLDMLNQSSKILKIDVTLRSTTTPEPLKDINDMVWVEFPCHLEEPIKIESAWLQDIACILCGIQYPVDLVRVLPEEENSEQ
jgi:hypothetical protein